MIEADRSALFMVACLAAIPLSLLAAQMLGAAVLPFHGTALSFTAQAALAALTARWIARGLMARRGWSRATLLLVLVSLVSAGAAAWLLVYGSWRR